jgi:hypothetical protein
MVGLSGLHPTGAATTLLPGCPAVSKRVTGEQTRGVGGANHSRTWDLKGAVWNRNAPRPIVVPVRSGAWTRGCVVGGRVNGTVPRDWTRDQWYNGEDGGQGMHGAAFRPHLTAKPRNFLRIEDAFVEDYQDAFDPRAARQSSTTYLINVHTHFIRDDCVQNELVPHNLVISNSLLDGCFAAFAERPAGAHGAANGTGRHRLVVENSLVYVQPQPLGPNYCGRRAVKLGRCQVTGKKNVWLGSYGIWKWSRYAARKVTVRNTIFRLDMPSYVSCLSQRWPAGTYQNVTLVWTGKGPYKTAGHCQNRLPKGVKLTRNEAVWTNAEQAWRSR